MFNKDELSNLLCSVYASIINIEDALLDKKNDLKFMIEHENILSKQCAEIIKDDEDDIIDLNKNIVSYKELAHKIKLSMSEIVN